MSTAAERRRYTRIGFGEEVTLTQFNCSYETKIVDISLNGIRVETPRHYELNTTEPAEICLNLSDDTQIYMSISLKHGGSEALGFQCKSIDVGSLAHLRRLIELNIDAPNAAEVVLEELIEAKALVES